MKITGWVIEYWNSTLEDISFFSSLDGDWKEANSKDIIYVWFYLGEYTVRLKGKDFYFFTGDIFGGYNDDIRSETSHDGHGVYFKIVTGKLIKTQTPDHTRPDFIKDDEIKAGIWVIEPYATRLGLSFDSNKSRSKPILKRYIK